MKKLQTKLYGILGIFVLSAGLLVNPAYAQVSTVSCPSYTRDLTVGSTGSDVVSLQTFLQNKGHLVMPVGVSKGYFGSLTASALARYQASQGIVPAVGYFGPITRGNIQNNCTPGNGGTQPTNPNNPLEGGEASLEKFEMSSGDDSNVKEDNSAEIAEIEFDVEDGDVLIDRVDLQLVADSGNEETDPWKTFESLRLLINGKEVADADLSDEDEYLDEDDGTIRLSGINYKVDEGDSVTIVVEIEAQNNVDGVDSDDANWTINVLDDGIRATDAEGIQQYIGNDSETVEFEVVARGDGEELNVSNSSEDPDSTTLEVMDNKKSDEHEIFAFELGGEESDIEIDSVQIVLNSDVAVSNVISDLILEIDGEEFDDWSYVGSGTSTRTVEFDIDGDYTLDADDEVTVVLLAEFKAANGSNYTSGATIQASIVDGAVEGEGSDDVSSEGNVSGEEHTLADSGIVIPANSFEFDVSTQGDNDTVGVFELTFDVTAFEEDFYITDNASTSDSVTDGIQFTVEGGTVVTSGVVSSTAEEDTDGVFTVKEGETETFTLLVTVDPTTAGQYRVVLNSVFYTENSNGTSSTVEKVLKVTDFRTTYKNINN